MAFALGWRKGGKCGTVPPPKTEGWADGHCSTSGRRVGEGEEGVGAEKESGRGKRQVEFTEANGGPAPPQRFWWTGFYFPGSNVGLGEGKVLDSEAGLWAFLCLFSLSFSSPFFLSQDGLYPYALSFLYVKLLESDTGMQDCGR